MRKYPDTLLNIIAQSELNINNISNLSGISNAYLTKLSKGRINHPGKDKIASILLALNYTIAEINEILAQYDYQQLNRHDIPDILINNQRRKITGRLLPSYERLHFEMVLAVFERIGGTKILVKNRPSGIYQPHPLYMANEFQREVRDEVTQFQYDLTSRMVEERLKLFRRNCRAGNRVINYICGHCFDENLDGHLQRYAATGDEYMADLFAKYYANAISSAIKFPHQHKIHIIERCTSFEFLIQNAEGKNPTINFTSNAPHARTNPYEQHNLRGFSTDSASILHLFNLEVDMCKAAINPKDSRNTPEGLREYVARKFGQWKRRHLFEEAMDELMATPGVKLF